MTNRERERVRVREEKMEKWIERKISLIFFRYH